MDTDSITVRLAVPDDEYLWNPEPEPDAYQDEIWEMAYHDLKVAMKTPTRQFRRKTGLLLTADWWAENRTVRLIAEQGGSVVGLLVFRREGEFFRSLPARILDGPMGWGTPIFNRLLEEARREAATRGIRWLTYRVSAYPTAQASLEAAGFIEYGRLPGGAECFDGAGKEWNGRRYTDEVCYYLPTSI